jgi:hypothetical protein
MKKSHFAVFSNLTYSIENPSSYLPNSLSRDCLENSPMAFRLRSWMVHSVQNGAIWPLVTGLQSASWGPIRISRQSLQALR